MEIDKNTDATVSRRNRDDVASGSPAPRPAADVRRLSDAPDDVSDLKMVEVDMSDRGNAVSDVQARPRSQWRTFLRVLLGSLFAFVLLAIILAFSVGSRSWGTSKWDWDKYIIKPGSASSATRAIEVTGIELFPAEGEIAYTTVAIVRDPTVVDVTWSKLQEGHIFVDPVQIDGEDTREETRERTRIQMVRSQSDAAIVALTYLGYELNPVERGATVVENFSDVASANFDLGDTIVGINGERVGLREDLVAVLYETVPGEVIELEVQRTNGSVETIPYELGERPPPAEGQPEWTPEQARSGFIGVALQNDPTLDMPFEINVNVGEVRGPSAGLAFTLAIVEVLTPGSLTGGLKVATTGTIDANGVVGPVGGVHQKTLAAEAAGMDVFLVPESEFDEATQYADRMEIVQVDTFTEAIEALAERGGNGLELEGMFA